MDRYYETYRASIHRGVYPLAARGDGRLRGRAREGRRVHRLDARRDGLHPQRDRGDQPRRLRVGPRATSAPDDLVRRHADGAPLQPRPVAAARAAGSPTCRSTTRACSTSTRSTRCSRSGPKLVAVAHVSNVLGTINPIAEIARARARRRRARRSSTARRPSPHLPVDVAALGADFYAWTGHKAYGPTGIGVLHGRRELLEAMPPFLGGGHMISRVGDFESTWAEPPAKFEAGTMPIAEAIGLGAAVDWLSGIGMDAVREHGRDVDGLRARAAARGRRARRSTARATSSSAARSARSRSTASTRTTSPRSSAARASACAPATTARSR